MRKSHGAPTLEDVARRAGVSTATVSRVLNAPHRVVKATRARVDEAVSALGYLPHFGARAMAAQRTSTIGAIIPTMENAIFARGIQAFQEELHDRGYTLLVASSSYSLELEAEQVRALVARGADGLLLIGVDRSPEILAFLRSRRVPAVSAWASAVASPVPTVGFDNRHAMRELAREVLALGHRRVAMISAPTASNDRARMRVEGVRDAMRDAGLDGHGLSVVETDYGIDTGGRAFDEVMGLDPAPSVVMCGNDVLAAGAVLRARERGIDVPGDVSVTGFDDIELARVVAPALATVHVPHREMGRRAAEMLVAMVEGEAATGPVELPTRLCRRASLAPPRGRRGDDQ